LRGFGLASVAVVGEVSVNVEAEDLRATNVTLLVVPDDVTSQSLVFGLDFLVKHYMVVDTVKRELRYSPPNESSYAVKLQSRPGFEIQSLVRTSNEISIYPNERILIRAKLCDDSISDVVDGYVDPFCVVSNEGANLEVAYSVSSAKNGYVIVELMNLNPIKVTLKQRTKLGLFVVSGDLVNCVGDGESDGEVTSSCRASDLFDLTNCDLSEAQVDSVKQMLNKRHAAISLHKDDLGKTKTTKHVIDVQGNPPNKQRYRRFQGPLRHETELELQRLEKKGIIERSNSPWASPLVPIRKKTVVCDYVSIIAPSIQLQNEILSRCRI
jgi:hypothetical protein